MTASTPKPPAAPAFVWWILWFALTNGLILQRVFLGGKVGDASGALAPVALAPLLVGAGIRFFLLPRLKNRRQAFPVFVVGLASSEACGLLGIFLGGAHRDELFAAALVMLLLYAPIFARRYDGGGGAGTFRQS